MPRLTPTLVLTLILSLTIGLLNPLDAWARKSRSSGGYSRPSSSLSQRTPSTRPSRATRTPSVSGGYSRPRSASSSITTSPVTRGSASDQVLSRQGSQRALDDFRRQREPEAPATEPLWSRPSTSKAPSVPRRPSTYDSILSGYGGTRGASYVPGARYPVPASRLANSSPSFGPWSAVLLWGLLETLSRPGHAEFFYHHAEDPGYRQWRAEAEEQAREDPALARQLTELDTRLASMSGPRDPNYPAPSVESKATGFPFGALLTALFLLLVGAVLVIVLWRRFFGDVDRRRSAVKSTGRAGARAAYRPDWFRVGMTLPVDPSLFILAESSTKLQAPRVATGSGLVSVERLGEVQGPDVRWYRLYVSGGDAFFQVHLDAHGRSDECRYFSRRDEVEPADADEWGVWLDRDEGLIGWPEFQTQDGRLYARLWSPGQARLEPYALRETLETADGAAVEPSRQQAMLYARATGAQPPAPGTEYLLVAANEQGEGAWVSLHVGIDIPVAGLNLS
ncbi:DUF2491 family protein [Thiocystis violacea]|uniref:DUF2491 family protein n=1 Tax=Thiocystis violacea TaxID=13725 RepID=UPI00190552A2|nr:DUF2491 family protein [Thiocystis violacea]